MKKAAASLILIAVLAFAPWPAVTSIAPIDVGPAGGFHGVIVVAAIALIFLLVAAVAGSRTLLILMGRRDAAFAELSTRVSDCRYRLDALTSKSESRRREPFEIRLSAAQISAKLDAFAGRL